MKTGKLKDEAYHDRSFVKASNVMHGQIMRSFFFSHIILHQAIEG